MVFAVSGVVFSTWVTRIPAVQQMLGLSNDALVLGMLGLAVGATVMLVATGPLISKFGSRSITAAGATVMCSSLPLTSFANSPAFFVIASFLLGAGKRLFDIAMSAHAARVEHEYRRQIFASFHAFSNIGSLVGSSLCAILSVCQIPVKTHFSVVATLLILLALAMVVKVFLPGRDRGQGRLRFALPDKVLFPLASIAFCALLVEGIVNYWGVKYLSEVNTSARAAAPIAFCGFSLAMIIGRLAAGRIADKCGIVKFVRASSCVAAFGFLLVVVLPVPTLGVVGFVAVGLGIASGAPLALSSAGHKQPNAPSQAVTAVASCGSMALLGAPILIGVLSRLGGLRLPLIGAAGLVLFIAVIAPALEAAKNHESRSMSGSMQCFRRSFVNFRSRRALKTQPGGLSD